MLERVLPDWALGAYFEQGKGVRWAQPQNQNGAAAWVEGRIDERLVFVFIEGDGRAWRTRSIRAADPTPSQAVAAQLANRTASKSKVLYLARPCQFFDDRALARLKECEPKLWTDDRYSSDTIKVISNALDAGLGVIGQQLVLVGYSGGGVVAALLAAQRSDVVGLITIAANLDVDAWTSHHRVSLLHRALLPVNYADQLSEIPQYHLLGTKDAVVPKVVHDSYLAALGDMTRVKTVYVDGYDHSCCWSESWLDHLYKALAYFNDNSSGVGITSHE